MKMDEIRANCLKHPFLNRYGYYSTEVNKGRTAGVLREDGRSSEASKAALEHQLLFRCNGLRETRLPSYQHMHH